MVKNCYGFIPKLYIPKPSYYKQGNDGNWCAIFKESNTKILFRIKLFEVYSGNPNSKKYLYLSKKVAGLKWEYIDGFNTIKSIMVRLRKEMDLPPLEFQEEIEHKFQDMTKWT